MNTKVCLPIHSSWRQTRGCIFGALYVPCIDLHARWESLYVTWVFVFVWCLLSTKKLPRLLILYKCYRLHSVLDCKLKLVKHLVHCIEKTKSNGPMHQQESLSKTKKHLRKTRTLWENLVKKQNKQPMIHTENYTNLVKTKSLRKNKKTEGNDFTVCNSQDFKRKQLKHNCLFLTEKKGIK